MFVFGLISLIVMGAEQSFVIFSWIDRWGSTNGILIRIGIVLAGFILILIRKKSGALEFAELEEIREIQKKKSESEVSETTQH